MHVAITYTVDITSYIYHKFIIRSVAKAFFIHIGHCWQETTNILHKVFIETDQGNESSFAMPFMDFNTMLLSYRKNNWLNNAESVYQTDTKSYRAFSKMKTYLEWKMNHVKKP